MSSTMDCRPCVGRSRRCPGVPATETRRVVKSICGWLMGKDTCCYAKKYNLGFTRVASAQRLFKSIARVCEEHAATEDAPLAALLAQVVAAVRPLVAEDGHVSEADLAALLEVGKAEKDMKDIATPWDQGSCGGALARLAEHLRASGADLAVRVRGPRGKGRKVPVPSPALPPDRPPDRVLRDLGAASIRWLVAEVYHYNLEHHRQGREAFLFRIEAPIDKAPLPAAAGLPPGRGDPPDGGGGIAPGAAASSAAHVAVAPAIYAHVCSPPASSAPDERGTAPGTASVEVAPAGSPVVAAPGANTARFCPLGSAMSVESAPVAGFKRPRACAPCPDVDGDEWVMPADPWHAVFDSTAKRKKPDTWADIPPLEPRDLSVDLADLESLGTSGRRWASLPPVIMLPASPVAGRALTAAGVARDPHRAVDVDRSTFHDHRVRAPAAPGTFLLEQYHDIALCDLLDDARSAEVVEAVVAMCDNAGLDRFVGCDAEQLVNIETLLALAEAEAEAVDGPAQTGAACAVEAGGLSGRVTPWEGVAPTVANSPAVDNVAATAAKDDEPGLVVTFPGWDAFWVLH